MQITVLGAIIAVMMLMRFMPAEPRPSGLALPAAIAYVLVAGLLAGINSLLAVRGMQRDAGITRRVMLRHNRLALLEQLYLVLGLGAALWLGCDDWAILLGRMERIPLAPMLAPILPFIAALVLTWLMEYPFHRAYRTRLAMQHILEDPASPVTVAGPWTRGEYLGYNLRHELLFVLTPVGLIVLLHDVLALYAAPHLPPALAAWAIPAATAVASLGVFLMAPAIVVNIWRTSPLPEGPLRSALEAMAVRMKVKFRRMLVWHSGGVIANAAVMGMVGRFRYVLLSDALLEQMSDRDIAAVFAHEAQHIKGMHIFYSMLFAVSTATLCAWAAELVRTAAGLGDWEAESLSVALLAAAWAFGFGWLSRRFERQSDVNGAWLVGQMEQPDAPADIITPLGAEAFAHALQTIAKLNGISLSHRNWRHGSLESRISYVLWLGSTFASRTKIDRLVFRMKIVLWLATAASVAVLIWA